MTETVYYYGVQDIEDLLNCARFVVDALGGGKPALVLMLGTTCPETHFATYPDKHPEKLGVGLGQCDQIALDDIKMHIRHHDRNLLKEMGYNIDKVELSDLAYDPVLAFAIMRLHYKRVPEALPAANDIEGQGRYWKKYYNTEAGKGNAEKYVKDFFTYMPKIFQPKRVAQG